MTEPDLRETVADILRGLGRARWRAARGRTMEFGGPELRDLTNLRRAEFALRWVARREREMGERDLHNEIHQLREECGALEGAREGLQEEVMRKDEEIERLRKRLTELEALGAKAKEGEST